MVAVSQASSLVPMTHPRCKQLELELCSMESPLQGAREAICLVCRFGKRLCLALQSRLGMFQIFRGLFDPRTIPDLC